MHALTVHSVPALVQSFALWKNAGLGAARDFEHMASVCGTKLRSKEGLLVQAKSHTATLSAELQALAESQAGQQQLLAEHQHMRAQLQVLCCFAHPHHGCRRGCRPRPK